MCKCEKCGELLDKKHAARIILKYREHDMETRIRYVLCGKCMNLVVAEIKSEIAK